jgi:hypothetical protein
MKNWINLELLNQVIPDGTIHCSGSDMRGYGNDRRCYKLWAKKQKAKGLILYSIFMLPIA